MCLRVMVVEILVNEILYLFSFNKYVVLMSL